MSYQKLIIRDESPNHINMSVPYTCPHCSGGYARCGKQSEHCIIDYENLAVEWCTGGSMCWNPNVVALVKGTDGTDYWVKGTYDGEGCVVVTDYYDDMNREDMLHVREICLQQVVLVGKEFSSYFDKDMYVADSIICDTCFKHDKHPITPAFMCCAYFPKNIAFSEKAMYPKPTM